MKLQDSEAPTLRVLCMCGKPLDRLVKWGDHYAPSRAMLRPKESPYRSTVRRGQAAELAADPSAGDLGYRWRCRPCRAVRVLRADTVDRIAAVAAEQGRDVVLGVDA